MVEVPVLYTHTDFDGVVSAVLVTSGDDVSEVRFAEPDDIQQKRIDILKGAIIADLPFHHNAGKWFDHHASSAGAKAVDGRFDATAKSAGRVILDYYENPYLDKKFGALVDACDKIDSASFTEEDIRSPSGYYLLSFALDADDTASDAMNFRRWLIEAIKKNSLEQLLQMPEVKSRVDKVMARRERMAAELERFTTVHGRVCVIDGRELPAEFSGGGTKFLSYLLHPQCIASVKIRKGRLEGNTDFSMGENIFFPERGKLDLGAIARKHGGGGHRAAAGFRVPEALADSILAEVVAEINAFPLA